MAYFRCTGNSGGSLKLRTAQGEIASFETTLPEPLQSVKCEINATGGNGTPDNPNPIVGYSSANITRCGVNLWDEVTEVGTINNTTGENEPYASELRAKNYTRCTPNTTYYNHKGSGGNGQIYYYDENKTYIGPGNLPKDATFTTPNNAYFFRFRLANAYGTTYNNDISINYPSTDTTYHAYNGQTYTIAFGQTVYGGVLDVTRGKLHVTHILKKISDISWTYRTISGVAGYIFLSNDITGAKAGQSPTMASCYAIKTNRNYIDGDGQVAISNNTTALDIVVKDDTYTSADDFVQNRGNETFVFELATPFDIDLTPVQIRALVGENNVFADCGQTEVKYLYLE